MTWEKFCNLAGDSLEKWSAIKTDLFRMLNSPSDIEFLNNSYLVICEGHSIQIDLQSKPPYIGKDILVKNNGMVTDMDELILSDDIQIEVRFPSVNIGLIQAVKAHTQVNKSKTCMCKACIKVVL
jgi:hypothetical protein